MDTDDLHKFAAAVAKVNGHPDPDAWANGVIHAFETGELLPVEQPAAEEAPAE